MKSSIVNEIIQYMQHSEIISLIMGYKVEVGTKRTIFGLSRSAVGLRSGSVAKNLLADAGDWDSIPALERSSGEAHGSLLQYYCLRNLMDRGASWAKVHGVTKSWM